MELLSIRPAFPGSLCKAFFFFSPFFDVHNFEKHFLFSFPVYVPPTPI